MPSLPSSSSPTPKTDSVTEAEVAARPDTSYKDTSPAPGAPPSEAEIASAPATAAEVAAAVRSDRDRMKRIEGNSSAGTSKWLLAAVILLRLIIGSVFIASGFAKAIDPWGSVYKISEYFAAWHFSVPHSLMVTAAVGLSTLEFVSGVMLLLGCYRRSVTLILTLLMAGMLPLSLYIALVNPVADCGCFGDLWVISNTATFWKNVSITAGVIFLLVYNKRVRCAVSPYVQWLPLIITIAYPLLLSLDGYSVQPLLDFRQYAVGQSLTETSEDSSNDAAASGPSYRFIYEKDGERRAFTVDALPDSTWSYVDREIIAGTSTAHTHDPFAIYDSEGNDIASDVLADEGPQLLVCIPSLSAVNMSYTYYLNELYALLDRHGIPMVGIIGGGEQDLAIWADLSMAEYPLFNGDPLQIKELVRGRAGIVTLRDGKVTSKSAAGPYLARLDADNAFARDDISFINSAPDGHSRLTWLTWAYLIAMAVIIAVNNGVLAVLSLWRHRMVKKMRGVAAHHQNNS
ncbi:MAG: DoxX family protein [Candidatus Amulumruptor caecigallinarius]|nr:DoxX family protein [Candidatus Amulumruptor caecigallinarius]MCM1396211.1 DoxX family protein [Candidatus Amulumruptor caecigallinarius]MCM1453789.1 DoxX family protein [bacterium]